MAYGTMSIKFDFVGIWWSIDEYIEYFSRKMQSRIIYTHAATLQANKKQGQIGV